MKNKIRFGALRRLLLELGFRETCGPTEIILRHEPSETLFVFRQYRSNAPVASYNLMEVKDMLDSRGLMSTESFETQFKKAIA